MPELLVDDAQNTDYLFLARLLRSQDEKSGRQSLDSLAPKRFTTYCLRAIRSGVMFDDIGALLQEHFDSGRGFAELEDRLIFVAAVNRLKMIREKKIRWGSKANMNFEEFHAHWPEARFVCTLRDPRDIYLSQKSNGAFNPDANRLGNSWASTYQRTKAYEKAHPERLKIVRYEDLTADPEPVLRDLCETLDIEFSDAMLAFHSRTDSTLSKRPQGQLSAKRVAQPIDTSSVGRWKEKLTEEEVESLARGAGEVLEEAGYSH